MNTRHGAGALACVAFLAVVAGCDDGASPVRPVTPGCSSLEDYLHVAAVARPAGYVLDAAVSGSHVFSLNGSDGLLASDFSDPSDVRTVATLPALTQARAIASVGSWLLVANGDRGIAVIDVSNPAAPRIASTRGLPGAMVDVYVDGDRAYFANDVLGLVIVDASAPERIDVLGLENTPGRAAGVAASGNLAFVLLQPSGLRIVNVLDPDESYVISNVTTPGFGEAVDARDDLVAVAVGQAGVQLVDVSRPATPVLAGIVDTPIDAIDVALVEETAFVADANGGVLILDVHDAAHPVVSGELGAVTYTHRVAVSDGRLAIADDMSGVRVVDIAPVAPAPPDVIAPHGDVRSLAMMGDLVVASDAAFGLHVVDPATRSIVGEFPMNEPPNEVVVVDSIAYVARVGQAVGIVDLHDPAAPVFVGELGGPQRTDHLVVAGEFGYLLQESGWIFKERINPPENAGLFHETVVSWTSITADEHFVLGTILYVPNERATVLIIPAFRMTPVSEILVSASPRRVVIVSTDGPFGPGTGKLAYVAESGFNNGQSGVEVFDVTDMNTPVLVGKFTCAGNAADVAFSENQVVVAQGTDGAQVFDLLGTARARPTSMLVAPAFRVAVSGETVVTASGTRGLLLASLHGCLSD